MEGKIAAENEMAGRKWPGYNQCLMLGLLRRSESLSSSCLSGSLQVITDKRLRREETFDVLRGGIDCTVVLHSGPFEKEEGRAWVSRVRG